MELLASLLSACSLFNGGYTKGSNIVPFFPQIKLFSKSLLVRRVLRRGGWMKIETHIERKERRVLCESIE